MSANTSRRGAGDRGYVTAETAVVLPVLVVLVAFAIWAVGAALARVRCIDAASAAARAAARGEPTDQVTRVAHTLAPGSIVTVAREGDRMRVTVRVRSLPQRGVLRAVPAVRLTATSVAWLEPGVAPP